jgi:hypothetical protein
MTKTQGLLWLLTAAAAFSSTGNAAEKGEHHLPHNHISLIAGIAYEEADDGHHEDGVVLGVDYIRQFSEKWGWGVTLETEAFGSEQTRNGVLAVPISYFATERLRLFVAPGIEFRGRGDPDEGMFRIGAGYEFKLGKHLTLAPEAQVDFIAGGTKVYVVAIALGYGF